MFMLLECSLFALKKVSTCSTLEKKQNKKYNVLSIGYGGEWVMSVVLGGNLELHDPSYNL